MDVNTIQNLIQSLGIPVCVALYFMYLNKEQTKQMQKMNEESKEELKNFFQDFIKTERETTQQKYNDAKEEREQSRQLLDKYNTSLISLTNSVEKIVSTQEELIDMIKEVKEK